MAEAISLAGRLRASVRVRVTAAVVVLVAVVFGVGAAMLLRSVERSVKEQVQKGNEAALGTFTVALRGAGIGGGVAVPNAGDRLIQVFGSDDRLLAASIPSAASGGGTFVAPVDTGAPMFSAALPADYVVTEGLVPVEGTGMVRVRAAAPTSSADVSLDAMRRALWYVVPALVALIGALTWMLVGRSLRPVAALTDRVAEISGTTLHERVPVPPSQDEVGHLARTMNGMLDRLDESARRQREFVADASHELRSPLASIRAQAEVATLPGTGVAVDDLASGVLAETDRLDAIVGDLLTLARQEEAATSPVPVDLGEVTADEAARARRVPVTVSVDLDDDVRVDGDPDGLRRTVRHLLDNAARHARERVDVSVARDAGAVTVVVDDDGNGVPEADRERILERFVRLDEARTRDAGGAGLGLAVVRDVVVGHGGAVLVGSAPAGGARFEIRLPAPP
jgi:signal transduction histidine kinase